jgi:hypothetical protein
VPAYANPWALQKVIQASSVIVEVAVFAPINVRWATASLIVSHQLRPIEINGVASERTFDSLDKSIFPVVQKVQLRPSSQVHAH